MTELWPDKAHAPWTVDQLANIIRWQAVGWVHPLTCRVSHHGALAVSAGRLGCLECGYRQTWVPSVVAEHGPPADPREELFKLNLGIPYTSEPDA